MITKEETTHLKAIAIVSIILCHFWSWIYEPLPIFKVIGSSLAQSGVFLFLFLSGYGITRSYYKKGIKDFWSRRLLKIYLPFLIVAIPELLLEIWHYRRNIDDMYIRSTFLSALGLFPDNLLDGTFWFIPFILLQYLAFYISFRVCRNRRVRRCAYIILVMIVYCIFKRYFTWTRENDIYGIGFWLGSVFSDLNVDRTKFKKTHICMVGTVCIVGYIITLMRFENAGFRFVNCVCISFIEILGTAIMLSYYKAVKWLKWIGTYSYELFLTEGFFFWHKVLYDMVGYNYFGLALHFCVILILSFFIHIMAKKINDIVQNKIEIYGYGQTRG